MAFRHTLTQDDLISTDNGPPYQYCEAWAEGREADGCPGNMFTGDQVVRTTEEIDGLDAVYCPTCHKEATGEVRA
jgi:hypothetical protein